MTRWKAAAIHLGISAVIACGAVALFVVAWFPQPHLAVAGGLRLLQTIVAVDVVLGPLLTLVVYKAGKKGLKFDLTVIALVQAAALGYGLYMAHKQRPVYVVVTPDRATIVRAAEIFEDPTPKPAAYAEPPRRGVDIVTLRSPTEDERTRLVTGVFDGQPDMDYRPAYYQPASRRLAEIAARLPPLSARLTGEGARAACYRRWIAEHGDLTASALRLIPLVGAKRNDLEAVFDIRDGRVLGYLAEAPGSDSLCEP